jgi:hypothetical protein
MVIVMFWCFLAVCFYRKTAENMSYRFQLSLMPVSQFIFLSYQNFEVIDNRNFLGSLSLTMLSRNFIDLYAVKHKSVVLWRWGYYMSPSAVEIARPRCRSS